MLRAGRSRSSATLCSCRAGLPRKSNPDKISVNTQFPIAAHPAMALLRASHWQRYLQGAAVQQRQLSGTALAAWVSENCCLSEWQYTTREPARRRTTQGPSRNRAPCPVGSAPTSATRQQPTLLPSPLLPLQAADKSESDPYKDMKDPSKTWQAYSAEPQGRQVPGPEDEGVEREVKLGKNMPASAEQAKEELKYVSGIAF